MATCGPWLLPVPLHWEIGSTSAYAHKAIISQFDRHPSHLHNWWTSYASSPICNLYFMKQSLRLGRYHRWKAYLNLYWYLVILSAGLIVWEICSRYTITNARYSEKRKNHLKLHDIPDCLSRLKKVCQPWCDKMKCVDMLSWIAICIKILMLLCVICSNRLSLTYSPDGLYSWIKGSIYKQVPFLFTLTKLIKLIFLVLWLHVFWLMSVTPQQTYCNGRTQSR